MCFAVLPPLSSLSFLKRPDGFRTTAEATRRPPFSCRLRVGERGTCILPEFILGKFFSDDIVLIALNDFHISHMCEVSRNVARLELP